VDFSLTEEQILLRDSVEKYVTDNCGVEHHRTLVGSELGFDAAAWQQFAELGWLSVPFAEDFGGFDGGAADSMVIGEAMGKGIVREPYLHTVVTCGNFLQLAGSDKQKANYIPAIIEGTAQWAFAFAEIGSDFALENVATAAALSGETYSLSAKKKSVLNAHCADHLIVSAATDAGVTLFIVDASAAGVSREPFVAVDGSNGAHVTFDQVQVSSSQMLGKAGQGVQLMRSVIDTTIVAMGGEALGAMQSLLAATVEYTKTRKQFGQAISSFQALQHRMADMYLKVEETRALLLNAAIQQDEMSEEASSACAALKVKIADAGRYVSQHAIQLHGGIGMTDELNVGHHYKRLLLLSKLYGDEGYYLQRFAELSASLSASLSAELSGQKVA
jgi:alkylation response protein AidB-like acyl-CoA dehydrogenase